MPMPKKLTLDEAAERLVYVTEKYLNSLSPSRRSRKQLALDNLAKEAASKRRRGHDGKHAIVGIDIGKVSMP